ncbi:MAG: hypothetical protein NVSMB2_01950 [Chloroflexota bacterium]
MPTATDPTLSILVFTYNRRRMLADCLATVLPTTADCEILVIDDASSDDTAELVLDYAQRDPRIRYIRRETNVGVTANVEFAAQLARGELISFLADDDSVQPGNYERKVALLNAYPDIGLVYSLAYGMDELQTNRRIIRRPEYAPHSYIGGRPEFSDLLSGNYIYANSVVFRRGLMDQYGVMDRNLPPAAYPLSDWDLWLRYTFHTQTAFINEPLANVRFHTSALSIQASDMAMGMIAVWRKWLVDRDDPPVPDSRGWERMHAVFLSEVRRLHASDQNKTDECLRAFEELQRAAQANASRSFGRRTRFMSNTHDSRPTAAVIWSGPVWSAGGLAADLRAMAASATFPDLAVRIEEVVWGLPETEHGLLERRQVLTDRLATSLPDGVDQVHVWQAPLAYYRAFHEPGRHVARLAVGPDDRLAEIIHHLTQFDVAWVPSTSQRDLLINAGIAPDHVKVLPSPVDIDLASAPEHVNLGTGRGFNFVTMVRLSDPGLPPLLRAFGKEFGAHENVALVLVVPAETGRNNQQIVTDVQQLIDQELGKRGRQIAPVQLHVGLFGDDLLNALRRSADAYVEARPGRWGRNVIEAMACGIPVIGAPIGVNSDLLNNEVGFLVSDRHRSLGTAMREAFSHPDETRRRGVQARAEVVAKNSPAVIGARLRELLAELRDGA